AARRGRPAAALGAAPQVGRSGGKGGRTRGGARLRAAQRRRRDRRDARALRAGRPAGPPGAARGALHLGRGSPSRVGRTLVTLTEDAAKTYEAAGVSLATADAVVERLRSAVESTGASGFGRFAGLFQLDEGRLLAASTDSVGSKLLLHRRAGTLRFGGMDLAAHCINDVLCSGAEPLFFLDYVAAAHIELEQVADLVE